MMALLRRAWSWIKRRCDRELIDDYLYFDV